MIALPPSTPPSPRSLAPLAAAPPTAVVGEWVDVAKTVAGDTSVWILAPDGADALVRVRVGADGRAHTERRYFGRWSLGSDTFGGRALCFVRRPGRDATSCATFTLDTLRASGAPPRRRLVLRGYAGQHHTSDRVLLARGPAPSGAHPEAADAVPGAANVPAAGPAHPTAGAAPNVEPAAGTFHPRAVQPERPSVATHAGTVAPGYAEFESGVERDAPGDGTYSVVDPIAAQDRPRSAHAARPATAEYWRDGHDLRPRRRRGRGEVARERGPSPAAGRRRAAATQASDGRSARHGDDGRESTAHQLAHHRTREPRPQRRGDVAHGQRTRAPKSSTLWAAAAGIPVRGGLGWALEMYGYPGTRGPAGNAPLVAVLTGPTFVVRPELALDFGTIVPLTGPQAHALYGGVVTSVGRVR